MFPKHHPVLRNILGIVILRVPGLLVVAIEAIVVVMLHGQKLPRVGPLEDALDDLAIVGQVPRRFQNI